MKKISFVVSIASLLAAAPALAADNDSVIKQLNTSAATVTVDQVGFAGKLNKSSVIQQDVTNGEATVTQINNGQENLSTVTQYDTRVKTTVEQNSTGGDNESIVAQRGSGTGAAGLNEVDVLQKGSGTTDNFSNIDQNGKKSLITVEQRGISSDNDSTIEQYTNNSDITLTQGGAGGNKNNSFIRQTSSNSTIVVNQGLGVSGLDNYSEVRQIGGTGNAVTLNQH